MEAADLQFSKDRLGKSGLKVTHQRMVVLAALSKSAEHPSPEQIYEKVKVDNPSISLATVYKNLEALSQAGLCKRMQGKDGRMLYDPTPEEHHHLYIENTGELVDFHDEELTRLITDYLKKKSPEGFELTGIELQVNGQKRV